MSNGTTPSNRYLWIGMSVAAVVILGIAAILLFSGDGDDAAQPTTTTTTAATTTTTEAPTTTSSTAATTTSTTEAAPPGTLVAETPVVAVLQPYVAAGEDLFPAGSVEAHWYQWEGLYVVLYRGIDAETTSPLCPGNSIQSVDGSFLHVSNSPFGAEADEICVDVPRLAQGESGARSCGSLLYYITEIPVEVEGTLYGTIEVNDGSGFVGQTSTVSTDAAATPDFLPFQAAYTLPASAVDDGGTVICGS